MKNLIEIEDDFLDLIPSLDSRGMDLGLSRISAALLKAGQPCASIPAIHVAGTNGKGSIASFLNSCLVTAGMDVGLLTSPHLVSWCERISVNGQSIAPSELRQRLVNLKKIADAHQLTPFEFLLLAAFKHFEINKVTFLVLEVGLGGRLDATTAHPFRPVIAMGSIGLDHCEYLGHSLKEIAIEKAAVMTPGCIVVSSNQQPVVVSVLEEVAEFKKAKLHWVEPLSDEWQLGLPGLIQKENAAVAKRVLEELSFLGFSLSQEQIRKGLAKAFWPARLQKVFWRQFPVLIDGAHNQLAAEKLSKELHHLFGQEKGFIWILGIQINKDAPAILKQLLGPLDKAWIVQIPGHRSWSKSQLLDACSSKLVGELEDADSVGQVFSKLQLSGKWPDPLPVVTGSLYLLGDLLANKILISKGTV